MNCISIYVNFFLATGLYSFVSLRSKFCWNYETESVGLYHKDAFFRLTGESILQGEDLPLQGTILIIGPLEGDPGHHLVIGRLEWGCPVETYLLQVLAF